MSSSSSTRKPGKLGNRAAAFNQSSGGVPPMFSHTLKDTQKLGTRKFASKNKYIKKDVDIGNGIVGKDNDLEGLGDVINKVKKEGGQVQPGAIRKHKMVKQLSQKNFGSSNRKGGSLSNSTKLRPGTGSTTVNRFKHKSMGPLGAHSGHNKEPRKKIDIFAMMDDAIESGPTEEALQKAAAEKAAAEAPIPKAVVPAWKARLKMQGKTIDEPKKEEEPKSPTKEEEESSKPTTSSELQEGQKPESAAASSPESKTEPELEKEEEIEKVEPQPDTKVESEQKPDEKPANGKINIFAVVDGAIESGPTEEAKLKLAAEKAAAEAPIPKKPFVPAWKSRLKMQGKELKEPEPEPEPQSTKMPEVENKPDNKIESKPPAEENDDDSVSVSISSVDTDDSSVQAAVKELEEVTPPSAVEAVEKEDEAPKAIPDPVAPADQEVAKDEESTEVPDVPTAIPDSIAPSNEKAEKDESPSSESDDAPIPPKAVPDVPKPIPDPVAPSNQKADKDDSLSSDSDDSSIPPKAVPTVPKPIPASVAPIHQKADKDDSSSSDSDDSSIPPKAIPTVPKPIPASVATTSNKKTDKGDSDSDESSIAPPSPQKTVNFATRSSTVDRFIGEIDKLAPPPAAASSMNASMNMSMASMNASKPSLFDSLGDLFDLEKPERTDIVLDPNSPNYKMQLREKIAETERKIATIAADSSNKQAEMQKHFAAQQKKLSSEFQTKIWKQRKINESQEEELQDALEDEKEIVDSLRAENKRLRGTQAKLPKQMKELKITNKNLEKANEEIAGHFKSLNAFAKKLKADHDRLDASNTQCRDEFLPRYRQELRERQQFITVETSIKNLYRDCMIKIGKHTEKSRSPALIDAVSHMVLQTEAEINPSFNPKLLFKDDSDSSSSSDSSSDSDDSSSDSDSD